MASLMRQLQSKAAVATDIATKRSTAFYKQLMEENKHHVVDPPTVQKCQELSKQLFYTRLASLPGRYEAFWKEVDFMKQKLTNRNDLKLEEIGIAALFAGECYAWFCVGEIVGRGGTVTGYKV